MVDYVDKETILKNMMSTFNSSRESVGNVVESVGCSIGYPTIFIFIILPLFILVVLLWFIFNQKKIIKLIEKYKLKNNYIKVKMINENKNIKTHLILMDKYNKFSFKDRSYTLEDLQKYIIGYEKGTPFLMYDKRFIFPLVLSEYTIKLSAMEELGLTEDELYTDENGVLKNKINALYLKIDSALLNTVYRKKLISDLYDVSKENKIEPMIYYIGFGVIVLVVLYFTGALTPILDSLGATVSGTTTTTP